MLQIQSCVSHYFMNEWNDERCIQYSAANIAVCVNSKCITAIVIVVNAWSYPWCTAFVCRTFVIHCRCQPDTEFCLFVPAVWNLASLDHNIWQSSIGVNPLVSTMSVHPQFFALWCPPICEQPHNVWLPVQMHKMLQLLGDFVPQTPYQSFAPGPHWGTSDPPAADACIKWQWIALLQSTVVF